MKIIWPNPRDSELKIVGVGSAFQGIDSNTG